MPRAEEGRQAETGTRKMEDDLAWKPKALMTGDGQHLECKVGGEGEKEKKRKSPCC